MIRPHVMIFYVAACTQLRSNPAHSKRGTNEDPPRPVFRRVLTRIGTLVWSMSGRRWFQYPLSPNVALSYSPKRGEMRTLPSPSIFFARLSLASRDVVVATFCIA